MVFDSEICIQLHEVSLDTPQLNFRALSYVRGDAQDTRPILIEGKILLVTKNCETALRCLRQAGKTTTIWIDAICIDQSNLSERSRQVTLMGEIYRNVEGVVAFLGHDDEESPRFCSGLYSSFRKV
jgi:hypothetical protein